MFVRQNASGPLRGLGHASGQSHFHPMSINVGSQLSGHLWQPTWEERTASPKYAAFAIAQKSPTSTTPVNIFIRDNNYHVSVWAPCLNKMRRPHLERMLHVFLVERRINDKVAIIAHHRTSFHLCHSKCGARGTETVQILKKFRVGEGRDFYWDTLLPLRCKMPLFRKEMNI